MGVQVPRMVLWYLEEVEHFTCGPSFLPITAVVDTFSGAATARTLGAEGSGHSRAPL